VIIKKSVIPTTGSVNMSELYCW